MRTPTLCTVHCYCVVMIATQNIIVNPADGVVNHVVSSSVNFQITNLLDQFVNGLKPAQRMGKPMSGLLKE